MADSNRSRSRRPAQAPRRRTSGPTAPFDLASPVTALPGVGPRRAEDLARAGVRTVDDLLGRFPLRYEDRSRLQPIGDVRAGELATLAGELVNPAVRLTRRPGFRIFQATLRDASGQLALIWPNQPYLAGVLRAHVSVVVFGTVERRDGRLQMLNPAVEVLESGDGESIHTGRIVPVYERVGSVTPRMQRRLTHDALMRLPDRLEDPLPDGLLERLRLPGRRVALEEAHFPPNGTPIDQLAGFRTPAQIRLIVEEFFLFQAGLALDRRRRARAGKRFPVEVDDRIREAARRALPFRLTAGQREALAAIVADMRGPCPMNRLLQGDVGAGKTIVAVIAALVALENGLQVALMAPTELLAEQHAATIRRLLEDRSYAVVLITGTTPAAERARICGLLERGEPCLVVGTHALIQQGITFGRLGLAIVDEQHRFGVFARAALGEKGDSPDLLVMTATPIPRTLALTLFGDLDVSVIADLPPGRTPIDTFAFPLSSRAVVYASLARELDEGRQAYVVYPLVEQSEKVDLSAAVAMADELAQEVLPAYRVGLVHGRMAAAERDRVMERFAGHAIDLLVATTVVEVGIDVPNASVMVVEHAERFGLAQLHQLRGRVGRGAHRSRCVLLYQEPLTPEARARLDTMVATTDGFVIAERDLELRGPGDLSGVRQAGMPTLRIGDLVRDRELVELARQEAFALVESGGPDVDRLEAIVRDAWAQRFRLVRVG